MQEIASNNGRHHRFFYHFYWNWALSFKIQRGKNEKPVHLMDEVGSSRKEYSEMQLTNWRNTSNRMNRRTSIHNCCWDNEMCSYNPLTNNHWTIDSRNCTYLKKQREEQFTLGFASRLLTGIGKRIIHGWISRKMVLRRCTGHGLRIVWNWWKILFRLTEAMFIVCARVKFMRWKERFVGSGGAGRRSHGHWIISLLRCSIGWWCRWFAGIWSRVGMMTCT